MFTLDLKLLQDEGLFKESNIENWKFNGRLSEKEVSVYAQGKNDFTAKDQTEIQGSWIQSQNGNRRR